MPSQPASRRGTLHRQRSKAEVLTGGSCAAPGIPKCVTLPDRSDGRQEELPLRGGHAPGGLGARRQLLVDARQVRRAECIARAALCYRVQRRHRRSAAAAARRAPSRLFAPFHRVSLALVCKQLFDATRNNGAALWDSITVAFDSAAVLRSFNAWRRRCQCHPTWLALHVRGAAGLAARHRMLIARMDVSVAARTWSGHSGQSDWRAAWLSALLPRAVSFPVPAHASAAPLHATRAPVATAHRMSRPCSTTDGCTASRSSLIGSSWWRPCSPCCPRCAR